MIHIELKNIFFSYQIGFESYVDVIKNLNISFHSGEIIGIIGKNGSGKSTLMNLLSGAIKPTKGYMVIDFDKNNKKCINKYIPLVSQNVNLNIFPTLTVYENYCLFINKNDFRLRKFSTKEHIRSCLEVLEKADMGIEQKINEQIRFLSGGQKQAVSILFAIEQGLPILLMDEPTASLDPFSSEKIINLARRQIAEKYGVLILVSHNLNDIIKYSTRILALANGQLKEICQHNNIKEADLMQSM